MAVLQNTLKRCQEVLKRPVESVQRDCVKSRIFVSGTCICALAETWRCGTVCEMAGYGDVVRFNVQYQLWCAVDCGASRAEVASLG